jgi:MFS family permease
MAMACIFLVSIAMPTVMTTVNGLLQVMAPPKMRGRLLSAFIIVSFGIQPVAALVIGFFASRLGIANAILIDGIAIVIGALTILIARPELRSWLGPEISGPETSAPSVETDKVNIELA